MKHGAVNSTTDVSPGSQTISVTPSGTISINVSTGSSAIWTAGENETVNATGAQFAGQRLVCIITNDATLPRTITFGTGFRALATIIGTASKVSVIEFVSDGTSLIEIARSVAIT